MNQMKKGNSMVCGSFFPGFFPNKKGRMNQSGVLLTLMVFLVLVGILAILENNTDLRRGQLERQIDSSAFEKADGLFNQAYFDVISLQKTGNEKRVQARGLPFDYNFGDNYLLVRQAIPLSSERLTKYYDYLNAYSLFLKNPDVAGKGVHATLDLTKSGLNKPWLSAADPQYKPFPKIQYLLKPQCLVYYVNRDEKNPPDTESNFYFMQGDSSFGCQTDFNWSDLNSVKVVFDIGNFTMNYARCPARAINLKESGKLPVRGFRAFFKEGPIPPQRQFDNSFNSAGANTCALTNYDDRNALPYVEVYAKDSTGLHLVTKTHLLPNKFFNWVVVSYADQEGAPVDERFFISQPNTHFDITLSSFQPTNGPAKFGIPSVEFGFESKTTEFILHGVDLNVSLEGFDITRYS